MATLGTVFVTKSRTSGRWLDYTTGKRKDEGPNGTVLSVSVITPTTGDGRVVRAAESVARQSHGDVRHFIVFDGAERLEGATDVARTLSEIPAVTITSVPVATGHDRFLGHRIYAAWPFLVPGDAVVFLDEDNWFEPDHIASLATILDDGKQWAYALRRIFDADGQFICNDDCQSLGRWEPYDRPGDHLVDTNCYMLLRGLACALAPIWNRPSKSNIKSPDRLLCQQLLEMMPSFDTTGRHTVNYTAGNRSHSVQPKYFLKGNAIMRDRYPDGFPWLKV